MERFSCRTQRGTALYWWKKSCNEARCVDSPAFHSINWNMFPDLTPFGLVFPHFAGVIMNAHVHTCMHIQLKSYTHTHTHTHTHIYINTNKHACIKKSIHLHIHVSMHTQTHTHACTQAHTHIHIWYIYVSSLLLMLGQMKTSLLKFFKTFFLPILILSRQSVHCILFLVNSAAVACKMTRTFKQACTYIQAHMHTHTHTQINMQLTSTTDLIHL